MYHRKGMSSILGTLVFIGILFSAVMPMFIQMRQADVYYEQQKLEVNLLDDEKSREDLTFSVWPNNSIDDDLVVEVDNACATSLKVVRVWINEIRFNESEPVASLDSHQFGPYDVPLVAGKTYDVRVATERGNVYELGSGDLEYDGADWVVQSMLINVLVSAPGVVFKIELYKLNGTNYDYLTEAQVWKLGGTAFQPFEVSGYGTGYYKIVVKRGNNIVYEEEDLHMNWPDGPSTLWVYA